MFQEALTAVAEDLEEAKATGLLRAYGLIGGLAVSAWGVPRATRDIDFAVALGPANPFALASFLGATYSRGGQDDPLPGVISGTVISQGSPVPFQLIQLPPAWSELIASNVVSVKVFDRSMPVVSWMALILLKLYAGGPQDLVDAQELLRVNRPGDDEVRRLRAMAESVDLSKDLGRLLTRSGYGREL